MCKIRLEYEYIDDEEREIIESYSRGEWTPLSPEESARHIAMLKDAALRPPVITR